MRGNSFGKLFSITSFGESHGKAMGVVIDGMPSNIAVDENALQTWLDRRAPGRQKATSNRQELDFPEILSGVFEGLTLGSPIAVLIANHGHRSEDYQEWKDQHRPGHADATTIAKYGIRDWRGGGRASGRETVARVIGGYFASLILPQVHVVSKIMQVGPHKNDQGLEFSSFQNFLLEAQSQGQSWGSIVQLKASGIPAGLGEPVFDKLKADLAKALFSIGGVVGLELGEGRQLIERPGTEVSQNSTYFGGIEGGMSNGQDISLTVSIKPPSTVGEKALQGRHDPCLVPRILPVLESMIWMVIADHFLRQRAYAGL